MYVSDCISVNERGHLTIGSYDTVELVKQFGTPLYAYDENEIRKNLREFKKSIDDEYGGNGLVVKGVENSIANFARLGRVGMRETDHEILLMMTSGN